MSWALLIGAILRISSANRSEWLARAADRKQTGLATGFGGDALGYFTERVDPEVIRQRTAATLKLAKRNKVFEATAFIDLAIDGTSRPAPASSRPRLVSNTDKTGLKSGTPTTLILDPWETLAWPTVRVLRYRQHKPDGTIIQDDWLTDFSIARLGIRTFLKLAKSHWEIETQGLNDGKNLYGMEHIQHHHPNGTLANWLFLLLALMTERLHGNRSLHRGTHPILTSMQLKDTIGLHPRPAHADTS